MAKVRILTEKCWQYTPLTGETHGNLNSVTSFILFHMQNKLFEPVSAPVITIISNLEHQMKTRY